MKTPLFLSLFVTASSMMQAADPFTTITSDCNAMRPGDSFTMSEQPAFSPGERGTGRVWHMPDAADDSDHRRTYLMKGDTLVCLEYPEYLTFDATSDTVRLTSAENREMRVDYDQSPPVLRFPMQYGDSIASPTSGRGLYGKRIHIGHRGNAYIVADGTGSLTDGTDTLRHVLRIHSHHEYRRFMSPDTAQVSAWMNANVAADSLPVFTDERHSWYRAGSRYPVMERVSSAVSINGDTIMSRAVTLLCLPELQRTDLGEDPDNTGLLARIAMSESDRSGKTDAGDSIDGFPATVDALLGADGHTVNVTYTIYEEADVRLGVFDALGRTLCSIITPAAAPGTHEECLSLSSPPAGNLLLTVWINETNSTFKVRTE